MMDKNEIIKTALDVYNKKVGGVGVQFASGSYTGTVLTTTVSLPFTPKLVIIVSRTHLSAPVLGVIMSTVSGAYVSGAPAAGISSAGSYIIDGGFELFGQHLCANTRTYDYVAVTW